MAQYERANIRARIKTYTSIIAVIYNNLTDKHSENVHPLSAIKVTMKCITLTVRVCMTVH